MDDAAPAWVAEMYESVDGGDVAGYLQRFAEDAEVRLGSAVATGRDAIRSLLEARHAGRRTRHRFVNVWHDEYVVICELDVQVTDLERSEMSEHLALTVLELRDGRISSMRSYRDT